jgi:hypothetical protein
MTLRARRVESAIIGVVMNEIRARESRIDMFEIVLVMMVLMEGLLEGIFWEGICDNMRWER